MVKGTVSTSPVDVGWFSILLTAIQDIVNIKWGSRRIEISRGGHTYRLPLDDFSEDDMFSVQVRCGGHCDKELRSVGVGTCIGLCDEGWPAPVSSNCGG